MAKDIKLEICNTCFNCIHAKFNGIYGKCKCWDISVQCNNICDKWSGYFVKMNTIPRDEVRKVAPSVMFVGKDSI